MTELEGSGLDDLVAELPEVEETEKAVVEQKKKKKKGDDAKAPGDQKSDKERIETSDWMKALKKRFGGTVLDIAPPNSAIRRLPSGVLALDAILGGGWAAGRVNLVEGAKSSGKSTQTYLAIRAAQNSCGSCHFAYSAEWSELTGIPLCKCSRRRQGFAALLDTENTYEPIWASHFGVDPDRLYINHPDYGEAAVDVYDALLRSKEFTLIALDSIAFLAPAKMLEESAEKGFMGNQPKMVGDAMRKFVTITSQISNEENGWCPTLWFTNQLREKIGVMYGSPDTTPGGKAPGFAASIEAKFRSVKYYLDEKGTEKPIKADFAATIEKNKTCAQAKMSAEFTIYFRNAEGFNIGEVDNSIYFLRMGQKLDYITFENKIWRIQGCDRTFSKKEEMENALITDKAWGSQIYRDFLKFYLEA